MSAPRFGRSAGGCTIAAVCVAFAALSCARRIETRPPDGLDYREPEYESSLDRRTRERLEAAWRGVEVGDVTWAERQYRRALDKEPRNMAAATGLAYATMRAGRLGEAERQMVALVGRAADSLALRVGLASLLGRRGEAEAALSHWRHAAELVPGDALVQRRLAETKLRVFAARVAAAQEAAASDPATAIAHYRVALDVAPEVGDARVALARLLAAERRTGEALALLRAAPSGDAASLRTLASMLAERERYEEALATYRALLDVAAADDAIRDGIDAVRRGLEQRDMPEPYREIGDGDRLSRADLIALVIKKVTALGPIVAGPPPIVTDVADSWARPYVMRALALGLVELYPNHTFQPQAHVRRDWLAHVISAVMRKVECAAAVPTVEITDMRRSHIFYDDAVQAVTAGLMGVTVDGAFEPWRPVGGAEAVTAIEALARLVGP